MSKNENLELLDGPKGLVRIVGLIELILNAEDFNIKDFMWSPEDIDEPTARGSYVRGLAEEDDGVNEIAYVMAGDITNDPDEPFIENLTDERVNKIDKQLEIDIQNQCKDYGLLFLEWGDPK